MSAAPHEFRLGPDADPDYYVIDATPVATGTEGILYRGSLTAGQTELDVAVKMLQPCFLDRVDEWFPRWCEQVELLRSLRFPGVVGVRDGFLGPLPHLPGEAAADRTLYLVMNWVDGESLDEWVRRRASGDVVGSLKQLLGLAAALDFMHSGRATGHTAVVHGDVKPSNILVTDEGTVLVDFGLSRGLPGGECIAGVSGTRGYIAPEILESGRHTPAADRYAFGAVAYFVLTGRELRETSSLADVRATLEAVPELSGRAETVEQLLCALDPDPAARPGSLTNWLGQVRRSTLPPLMPGHLEAASAPRSATAPTAEELRTTASRLAHALYAADTDADSEFLRQQSNHPGRSGALASEVISSLDRIWVQYGLAADVLLQIESAVAEGRTGEAQRLLHTDVVETCDGTLTSVACLLLQLERGLHDAIASRDRLVANARRAVSAVDDATKVLDHIVGRAVAIGVQDEQDLTAARTALEAAQVAVASDPLATDPESDLAVPLRTAGLRMDELERRREALPAGLAQATADLDTLSALAAAGAEALADARTKILGPQGLLEPLAPSVIEGDARSLRPWLDRIRGRAEGGDWRAAAIGIESWQRVAEAHLENARRVLTANREPVLRRDELRGLLESFRAKAAAGGRAEDRLLRGLYEAACDSLYRTQCDLDKAARLVKAYFDAVNAGPQDQT